MPGKIIYDKFRTIHPMLVTEDQKFKRVDNRTIKVTNKGSKSYTFEYIDDERWTLKYG